MKQLKHLRQTLWRALLCLTVVVGFASPGWAYHSYFAYYQNSSGNWEEKQLTNDNSKAKGSINIESANREFLILAKDNNYTGYYGCPSNYTITAVNIGDNWNSLSNADGKKNWVVAEEGEYDIEVELESNTWGNAPSRFKMIKKSQGGNAPANLYLLGIDNNWTPSNPIDMGTAVNGVFSKTVKLTQESSFSFSEKKGSNDSDWNTVNSGLRYGPVSDDKDASETLTLTNNTAMSNVKAWAIGTNNSSTWKLAAGEYVFKVDFSKSPAVLTVTTEGGGEVDPPVGGNSPYNYYLYLRSNEWIPFVYADGVYSLDKSVSNRNFCIVALDKNKTPNSGNISEQKIYTNNANLSEGSKDYPLTLNNGNNIDTDQFWGGNVESSVFVLTLGSDYLPTSVNITVPEKEYVPAEDYYFIGDLNDWFSTEFSLTEGGETSMEMFEADKENWKFREATASDVADVESDFLKGLESLDGWYVFDKFPNVDGKKTLSGQFQVSSGGTHIWSGAEVFGLCYDNVAPKDKYGNYNLNVNSSKDVLKTPISSDDIATGNVFKSIHRRVNGQPNVSFANFHLDCNAVADAKVFFKPNFEGKAELVVTGTPKNYYVFYYAGENGDQPKGSDVVVNHEENGVDKTITAKINSGKPNTNNYFLPGVKYNVEVPAVDKNGNTVAHMNVGNGIEMTKIKDFANKYFYDGTETTERNNRVESLMTEYGIDKDVAEGLVKGVLPNGRVCSNFSYLYITKVPNGFENPAGWKYNLKVNSEVYSPDNEKSVVIATNHIYYLKNIGGVAVHIDDTQLMSKPELKDYESKYYYRVYYSASSARATASDESYSIHVVDHYANNVIGDGDKEIYNSKDASKQRKKTLVDYTEEGNWTVTDADAYGWKELNPVAPETEGYTWHSAEENLGNFKDGREWHMHLVEKESEMERLLIPDRYNMSYVQILSILTPKSAKKSAPTRAASAANPNVVLKDVLDEARNNGAIISYAPGSLDFDNDEYHHPLQGNHLFRVLTAGQNVWTGIENIEDDVITDAEGDVNAALVYYNLQGVRVAEPTKGIFIEVRGNKSRKVAY